METIEKHSFRDVIRVSNRALAFAWKRERGVVIGSIVMSVLLAVLVYLQLVSFSSIINEIIRIKTSGLGITKTLITNTILLASSFLLPAIFQNIYSKLFDVLRTRIATEISLQFIDSVSTLDIGTIEGPEYQEKLELTRKWGLGSINNVLQYSINLVRDVAGVLTSGVILFLINPLLVALAVIGTIPYYYIENKYGKELFALYHEHTDDSRISNERNMHFKEPRKIVEILLFGISRLFRSQIEKIEKTADREIMKVSVKKSWATFIADTLSTVCLIISIGFVTYLTLQGRLLVGSLLLAFSTYRGFASTVQGFFMTSSRLTDQTRYAKKWFDIFDIKPKIFSKPGALKPDWNTPPRIEFQNISFAYPGTETVVLKDISLSVDGGEKLAIVGENGAGKTTLIKLLARVYDPTEGRVLVDGVDLKDIDLRHWHSYLGVLFQDFNEYHMTVREIIAISRPDDVIDDEKVAWASQMAGADGFIQELPKKYNQIVWKGFQDGVGLSKGQLQRLAVARIFYRNALISILDEPTAAIDAVAEEKIFEVLETKMAGKTVVLISHRFSTVKNADKIAVIEHGELRELGMHKDLLAKQGRYAELYTMQAKRYLEEQNQKE